MRALVLRISRFSTEDGPGIRTVVFLKGCPLRCVWCSTPESQRAGPELLHVEVHCEKCGRCVDACLRGALRLSEEGIEVERELCSNCGDCVGVCRSGAMRLEGTYMSVDEVFEEVVRDATFYRRTSGGITISGGEATLQSVWVRELLRRCKEQYIHTAIETSGFSQWKNLEAILEYLDLVFFDIKHCDPIMHKELTGVSNRTILENARRVCAMRPVVIRVPVVPGCNDSDRNILSIARFAARLGDNLQGIELLPYHRFGEVTYGRLGREYPLKGVEPPSPAHMNRLRELAEGCGVRVRIVG